MGTHLYRAAMLSVVLLVICGLGYPLAGWALSQAAFRYQADGSIGPNGSALIGQPWNDGKSINPMWFNGRPDSYYTNGDNPLQLKGTSGSSGAAALGPKSEALLDDVEAMLAQWRAVGVMHPTEDLVTSSGSGLDPDISPADAIVQIPMVAKARHLSASVLRDLVDDNTVGFQFGFLGSPYVDVLALNRALAKLPA